MLLKNRTKKTRLFHKFLQSESYKLQLNAEYKERNPYDLQ